MGQLAILIVIPLLFVVILFSFIIFAGNVLIADKRVIRFLRWVLPCVSSPICYVLSVCLLTQSDDVFYLQAGRLYTIL